MSQNLYLPEFIEQVSQIVFLAYLTVLGLITTVWGKMSQISYLREFIEQVSQIVFLAYFDRSRAFYHYIKKNVTKVISTRVL